MNGVAYLNGSTVLRTDIGVDDASLQCTTDSTTCCRNSAGEIRGGEFYFPTPSGGGPVPTIGGATIYGYYKNRGSQHIRLNRQPAGTISGQFWCSIPSTMGTLVDLFIDIGELVYWYPTCYKLHLIQA